MKKCILPNGITIYKWPHKIDPTENLMKEELEKLGIITIYRMLLKNLKDYPSINRYNIMMAVQDEFRENVKVSSS